MKRLINELIKNFKIMFRNWTSLSLLILAPIIFILLVGYAFTGDQISGVQIGVVAESGMDLSAISTSLSDFAEIHKYSSIEQCQVDLALQEMHICVQLEGMTLAKDSQKGSVVPASGAVVYYFDNSRRKLSTEIIQSIQEFFGLKAEEISIESAESIIQNIQDLIFFINERKSDFDVVRNESENIKIQLKERKQKLEDLRDEFMPEYLAVKDLQARLHAAAENLDNSIINISDEVSDVESRLQIVEDDLSVLDEFNETDLLDNVSISINSSLFDSMNQLHERLDRLLNFINSTRGDLSVLLYELDSLVSRIDSIKILLDEEIIRTDEYIKKIEVSVAKVDAAIAELDEQLAGLSMLEPGLAQKIVKPIIYDYDKLLKDRKNIQLAFPQLLVIVVMFLALLFSNIATLMEIHDKAYLRNLIAPVDNIIFFLGLFITEVIIVFMQILVLFVVAQTRLDIKIIEIFWPLSFITLLLIAVFVLVGMVFAFLFRTVQSSILVTIFSALIFFLFSSTLSLIEAMPAFAQYLSKHSPLVIGEFLVKQVQLFNNPLGAVYSKVLLLGMYVLVLFFLAVVLAKYRSART